MLLTDAIKIGASSLIIRDAQLRPDLLIDEVSIEAAGFVISQLDPSNLQVNSSSESRFRATISEVNLVNFALANLPDNVRKMLRETRITILQGKVQVQCVPYALPLTITVEASPVIVGGKIIQLNWHGAQLGGIAFPTPMIDLVARHLNQSYDLSTLPIDFRLEEIRCEPGRLTALGWAKLEWPVG